MVTAAPLKMKNCGDCCSAQDDNVLPTIVSKPAQLMLWGLGPLIVSLTSVYRVAETISATVVGTTMNVSSPRFSS